MAKVADNVKYHKPEKTISYGEAGIEEIYEEDRISLDGGEQFIISSVVFKPHQKFGEIALINGFNDSGEVVKYYTTSKTLTAKVHKICDKFATPDGELEVGIKVKVEKKRSENKMNYLVFVSPDY